MPTLDPDIPDHYLFPCALFANRQPHVVNTILGSCISVCLYDTKLKVGGINHFMLPFWNGDGLASPKYGNIAVQKLMERMVALGSSKPNIIAKVFGGANQMQSSLSVGERNREIAMEQLELVNIKVVAESTGGFKGRKIQFHTGTGEVLMKFLVSQDSNKVPELDHVDNLIRNKAI
ncbi:MAG: chemotaxis protein CheD [Ekhidna sp.]